MRQKIQLALINYDMGNLRSVQKALQAQGAAVDLVDSPFDLNHYQGLVLPGVGAFSEAVKNLKRRKLWSIVKKWIALGRPFLGVCLGYQLLFERSEEAGKSLRGLGIFKGDVKRLNPGKNLKVPHMGWNQILWKGNNSNPLLLHIPKDSYFYFVHSYVPYPKDKKIILTETHYGRPFASSVLSGNVFACQFHPEKSGKMGQELLRNFLKVCAHHVGNSGN